MAQRKGGMQEIGTALSKLRLPQNVKAHLQSTEVWTKWDEIVGAELSRVTAPIELRTKTLIIEVAHQAWAQQLHFLKPSILGKLRQFSKNSKILDLEFRIAKGDRRKDWASLHQNKKVQNDEPFLKEDASLSERQEITLKAVDDPDLRASIRKAMEAESRRLS